MTLKAVIHWLLQKEIIMQTQCYHHIQRWSPVLYVDPFSVFSDEYEVIGEAQWQTLESSGDEQVIKIYGFKYSKLRAILFHSTCMLLCGLPYFALAYYPSYNRFKYLKCSLKTAEFICGNYGHFLRNLKYLK